MTEKRDKDKETTSRDKGDPADDSAGPPPELDLSSAYATLLEQYREALARIHVLEMQNQNQANMVKLPPPPILSEDRQASIGALEATELAARIEAVERLLAKTVSEDPEPIAAAGQGARGESRDEIAQLRIQVQSLLGELSSVNGRHDRMRQGGSKSSSGNGSRTSSDSRGSWLNKILKR